jgi:hypothetical protein
LAVSSRTCLTRAGSTAGKAWPHSCRT